MNSSILEVVIKARDEASSVLNKVADGAKSLEPAFQKMATAGTIGLGAISAIAIKTISDFADAEKSTLQLRHAVIDVTHATEEQLKATEDLADALEKKGVLDGDNIKMGLAQLSTFGLSNEAVRGLGGSLADLAVNQFGVKASGDQLSDTANMIAKALNGQFGVLEKSGIRFSEAQQNMIKFGSEMEKVKAINEGFAQNLKYTNEVALGGLEGQMAKVEVQIGNISEAIGGALAPAFANILEKLTPVVDKVLSWVTAHSELVAGILIAVGAVSGFLVVIGTIGLVLPTIIAVINPFTLAIAGIVAGIAYFSTQAGGLDTILGTLRNTFDSVVAGVSNLIAYVKMLWDTFQKSEVATFLNTIFQMLWATLKDLWAQFKELWDIIEPVFMPLLKLLATIIGGVVITALTAFVVSLTAIAKGLSWLIDLLTPLVKIISEALVWAFNAANSAIQTFMGWIDNVIGKINSLIELAQRAASAVSGLFSSGSSSSTASYGGAKASGGSVYPGNYYLVGERGPELFSPNATGQIIPNSGNTGTTINISGNTFLGEEDVANKIGSAILNQLQFQVKI